MADEPGEPIEIFRARGLPEAYAIRGLLEASEISVRIENELLQGAVGDLPMGWATAPRIVVQQKDENAARKILDEYLELQETNEEAEGQPLRCLACGFPMGDADGCPECGWSYQPEASDPTEVEPDTETSAQPEAATDDTEQPKATVTGIADRSPAMTGRAAWAEVAAVLAVGVLPNLALAVVQLYSNGFELPDWADALQLTVLSGCTIFVTLYLIGRSGESWAWFGITRFGMWDIPIGLVLLGVAVFLWQLHLALTLRMEAPAVDLNRHPRNFLDNWLVVVKYAVAAVAEEIVTRAYLVTRLTQLLRSRGKAVMVAAILFASYHLYQGWDGVVRTFLFGLAYGIAFLIVRRIWPLAIGHALYNIRLELMT